MGIRPIDSPNRLRYGYIVPNGIRSRDPLCRTLGVTVKKSEDFSEWYTEVMLKSGLADYAPIKGCMIIREDAIAMWEKIQEVFNKKIKATGHRNVYFPMFIPEGFLKKEAEHFAGFIPEVAWVTQGGDTPLEEKLAVRPTSETIMYATFAKWITKLERLAPED